MRKCVEFIEEETLLQTNARKMGQRRGHIIVYRNPKCHTEISSEGIEYSWGLQRIITDYYRWIIIKIRNPQNNCSRRNKKRQPYHKAGLYIF